MSVDQIVQLIQSAIQFGTVILFGAMGEILTEKSGNLNLGVPGIMYLGGIAGLAASFFYEFNNPDPSGFVCLVISLLAAFAASALGGLLYSFLTITLRANQNVTGLTLTIFGGGVANFFGGTLNSMAGGVGQISVAATSAVYLATCVGAGVSGLGGLYYTMDYIKGTWANDGTIESLGWLAVALVIFATWRTVNAIWGSYLFGLLFWVYLIIPGLGRRDTYLFNMLPYLVTIAVLIFVSLRNKKENQPPASLGLAYFREER